MEVYAWREDGVWRYALLVGTNRNKTWEEVRAAAMDEPALRAALRELPEGTEVFSPPLPGSPVEPEAVRQLLGGL